MAREGRVCLLSLDFEQEEDGDGLKLKLKLKLKVRDKGIMSFRIPDLNFLNLQQDKFSASASASDSIQTVNNLGRRQ